MSDTTGTDKGDYPSSFDGVVKATSPSTLHMDGTSPVTVAIQATTDDLRWLKGKRVRLVVEKEHR